jgi:hypothetical protein
MPASVPERAETAVANGKLLVSLTFRLLFIGSVIADCWLLWDKDKQELWDKIAGTQEAA